MSGLKVLLIEDEGLVAMTMEDMLDDLGCEVVGSFGAVGPALEWLAGAPQFDGALLDVNLGGEMVYPVADALLALGAPFVFTTGYGASPDPRAPELVQRVDQLLEAAFRSGRFAQL